MTPQDSASLVLTPLANALLASWWMVALVIVAIVAGAFLKGFAPRLKGMDGERRVRDALDAAGFRHLDDVYLPSRSGVTQVDHVVRAGGSIAVIETKNYSGSIYGGKDARRWTQYLAGGRSRNEFLNPLHQNRTHVNAVQAASGGGAPVFGLVAFVGRARFPKGVPEGVVDLDGLVGELRREASLSRPTVESSVAWERLSATARKSGGASDREAHSATVARAASASARRPAGGGARPRKP